MLDGVGHSRHIILVAKAPNIDIHGGTGLVCLGIMNYEGFQLIWKADDPVGPVIQRRLL
jgi:hypothetical protein